MNHVAKILRHLCTIFDHHALGEQTLDGFIVPDESQVAHDFGPEARIDEVENGVLHAANVLINREPIGGGLAVEGAVIVVRASV